MVVANFQAAQELSFALLDKFSIDEPVVNAFEIAERMGIKLRYYVPKGNLVEASGFFDIKSQTIYVNSEDAPHRQLFTVAHELGHFLLNHAQEDYGVLLRLATPIDKDPFEQEANAFAANLLVPQHMLKKILKEYPSTRNDLNSLARLFGVSRDVIKFRLKWI